MYFFLVLGCVLTNVYSVLFKVSLRFGYCGRFWAVLFCGMVKFILSTIFRFILYIQFVYIWMENFSALCIQTERDSNLVNWSLIGPNYAGFRYHIHSIDILDLFNQAGTTDDYASDIGTRLGSGTDAVRWCRASVTGMLSKSAT
jgi:hypothetical protein